MKHFLFLLSAFCFVSASQAETFGTWIASYSLTGDDAAFDADPDNDGLPNGLEYALDSLNPTVPSMGSASLPALCFVRRTTGSAIGALKVTGGIGSLFTDIATGTVYRKTSGTGNTGWVTP